MATTHQSTTGQREHWPDEATELYLRHADRLEAMNGPFGEAMLDAARLQPGERVLDVGCGSGATVFDAARRVSPGGACVGIDITAELVDVARQHAASSGVTNVEFLIADAQVHPFEAAAFDVVISRFGIMFFADPEAAFANLARAVRAGGRLVTVCPSDPLESQWVTVAFAAATPHVGPPNLGPPGAPGPFAFADPQRLERTIRAGGFREVTVEAIKQTIRIGRDVDDVADFITSLPESHRLLEGQPKGRVDAVIDSLRQGFTPYARPDGIVVDESAWLASARR